MSGPAAPPLSILIAALGGEGGGVLMNWIVGCARAEGLPVQATSVPGVAQRTGSTSYYIEIGRDRAEARQPIFALVPMPGRVDVVIASELAEAGRMMERGFVSPARTTLITSKSRVLTTAEKMQMGDGRFDNDRLIAAGEMLSQRFLPLDLDQVAIRNGTMISATMFGALAGAGVLPWGRKRCEVEFGEGRSAKASMAGFSEAFAVASGVSTPAGPASVPMVQTQPLPEFPSGVGMVASLGFERCIDFQDEAYGQLYLARVRRLAGATRQSDAATLHALEEAARRLALWMAYEDIPRVADLKTRKDRFERIRSEADMRSGQLLQVTEFLKPGIDEIAAMLPARFGRRLMSYAKRGGYVPFIGNGIHLKTTTVTGFAMLRLLAAFRKIRTKSLRFTEEQAAIELWLTAMETALPGAPAFAGALAELPRVLKGYGETLLRGQSSYARIMGSIVQPTLGKGVSDADAPRLRKALAAALSDPENDALGAFLGTGAAA